MKKEKVVVLLSGGLDSTVLLHYIIKKLKKKVLALSFNYGQKHNKELEMAKWQIANSKNIIEHKIIDISFFSELLQGSSTLINGGDSVPDLINLKNEERKQPPTYIPNRNMVLLSLCASFAESRNCLEIYYGAQAQDEYGYWDCTVDFLNNINNVLNLNRLNKIKIKAPFINLRKSEEVKIGMDLNVDFSKTWSCYKGKTKHCGTCPTCVERKNAFKKLNIKDPTEYF